MLIVTGFCFFFLNTPTTINSNKLTRQQLPGLEQQDPGTFDSPSQSSRANVAAGLAPVPGATVRENGARCRIPVSAFPCSQHLPFPFRLGWTRSIRSRAQEKEGKSVSRLQPWAPLPAGNTNGYLDGGKKWDGWRGCRLMLMERQGSGHTIRLWGTRISPNPSNQPKGASLQ